MSLVKMKKSAGTWLKGVWKEHLVVAIFHCIGRKEFTVKGLTYAMDEAAKEHGGIFLWAEKSPRYDYSPKLEDVRRTLMLGNVIMWWGTNMKWLRCTELTVNTYGRTNLQKFTPAQQDIIRSVAARTIELSK